MNESGAALARAAAGPAAGERPFRIAFAAHLPYFAVAAVYLLCDLALVYNLRGTVSANLLVAMLATLAGLVPAVLISLVLVRFVYLVRIVKPAHPIRALVADIKALCTDRRRLLTGIPMIAALVPFMSVYGELKALIPAAAGGFRWDAAFDHADRVMHGGILPWEWLHPLIGHVPVSFAVNLVYNFWFFSAWMTVIAFAFTAAPGADRTRFFLTYMLTWSIGGSLMAMFLGSAGPAFYTRLGLAPDPYAPLMDYLRAANQVVPIWAVELQDFMWRGFDGETVLDGISAMPSMHNGTALLLALASARFGRTVRNLLWANCALIFAGSIHLGWHYAVDAYAAWALTAVIWIAAGPMARLWERQPWPRDLERHMAGTAP